MARRRSVIRSHRNNPGGFYTCISCGLGRPPAVAGGLIAVLAYNTAATGLLGSFCRPLRSRHTLHNAANRYMFVLGREGLLPGALGKVHARHASPYRASLTQTAFSLVTAAALAIAGLNPYLGMTMSTQGIGTLGVVALQATMTGTDNPVMGSLPWLLLAGAALGGGAIPCRLAPINHPTNSP